MMKYRGVAILHHANYLKESIFMDRIREEGIFMESGVNKAGEPFVHYSWKSNSTYKTQWTPQEARDHALKLLTVADAAESDAGLFQYLEKIGMEMPHICRFLSEIRETRSKFLLGEENV